MSALSPEIAEISHSGTAETALEENRRLRRTMRDLIALSALPAAWGELGCEEIARSLCDVLLNTLSLDLVYVRLGCQTGKLPVEIVRGKHRDPARDEVARAALASLSEIHRGEPPTTVPDPFGPGVLRVAVVRFGVGSDHGILIACSADDDFPTERDRLLLGVGANQTAIVVQRREAEEQVREQREWLRVALDSIGDAVIATDSEGQVTFLNSGAEELTGWTPADARGKPLTTVFRVFNERTREPIENPVDTVRREGRIVSVANEMMLIAKDGTERPIDESAVPIRDSANRMNGLVTVFRAVTEQRRRDQHRNARLAVTQALSQSATVQEAAAGVLQAICENLGWDLGGFWFANNEGDRLDCLAQWHRAEVPLTQFTTASSTRALARGEGLPGRVWASRQPVWIPDLSRDENFPRVAQAGEHGLRSAFACPVIIGDRTLGVMEFFTQVTRETDADLLEMMSSVAANVGQFIERKAAEHELRASEQELAEFFENATIGLHWVGPDGKILRVNRAELDMLGYTREEYLGHSISEFHADECAIRDILQRLKAGEKLVEYPARLLCKDGSIKHVLIDSSVMWDEGRFVHTRCFTRDITERKHAEMALADARSRLDAALDAGAIGTWTWDIPNNRLYADSKVAQLFNLPPSESDGGVLDKYFQSIHPDDAGKTAAALDRSVETGEPYEADYRIVQADGSFRWVTARGVVERDGTGRSFQMSGVLVDITDRKRLEEELRIRVDQLAEADQRKEDLLASLRDADRRKDEFLATLAHELRNPLAPIRNSLQILKMARVDAGTVQKTRAMMERQVHHLVRLVDDLLDVSRVMRGKIDLHKEPVELATVVARAVETAQPLIEIQGHRLDLSLPQESLRLDADPVRLTQVVANLLTNSAKYTEANGHIWVSARREADDVLLQVRDDGIGIAPEMLHHIFELFVQADHTSTKAQGGLGIGLTLAKNLVQMHGGTLEARSAGLGKGSEFTVRLPLMGQQRKGIAQESAEEHPQQASSSGQRLLVVDDNEDAATSLAILLRLQGHEVRVAHDGPTALALATSYLPNVILLDIGMPGMDGYQVARRLRTLPGLGRVVLAALTGWGQQEDRRRTAEAGFDHHFVKPLDAKVLGSLLSAL
jgi:PAS domain S-box-containing protein